MYCVGISYDSDFIYILMNYLTTNPKTAVGHR